MKKIKQILLSMLIVSSVLCSAGCKKEEEVLMMKDVPDYSNFTDQFDFYGYHSLHDGVVKYDDVPIVLGPREEFLSIEQYQLYKDVGMNIVYPQSILKIDSKMQGGREASWEIAKVEIDKLVSIGLDRVVLYDEDLSWLGLYESDSNENYKYELECKEGSRPSESLIGDKPGQYATLDDLDAKVEELLSLYAGYPGVYGVCLADEPKHLYVQSYAEVYNSIKRVSAKNNWNIYPDFNLNPLNLNGFVYGNYYPYVEGTEEPLNKDASVSFEDGMKRYQQYIKNYLDLMQPGMVQYDDYPLRNGKLLPTYIPCLQYVAEEATDRGIELHMVTQTFDMRTNGTQSTRKLTEAGAKWLNNMLLGFGVREISYFTYYTRTENRSDGESFYDGGSSFVDVYGKPMQTYYVMKDIMAANQKFAPTLFQFDYQKSGVFKSQTTAYYPEHLEYVECNTATYDALEKVTIDKECAMVNELYDDEKGLYMYMAMNITDPQYQGSLVYQTITLKFDSKYDYALVYRNGESGIYKLKNSTLKVKGAPGDASFVIPFSK